MNYILETCADSVQSAIEAKKGGANRIELCSNLVIGGTSPGESLFRQVKEQTGLNVRVLLRPDGTLNMEQMKALVEEAGDMGITLHRAFDVCRDPYEAMEQCISLGIDTILTSGQKSSAWEGRDLIKDLVKKSAGRIEILAGAGINPESIAKLAPYTNARAYHMSGKVVIDSRMEFRREGVPMGIPGFSEFEIWQTSAENIRKAVQVLQEL